MSKAVRIEVAGHATVACILITPPSAFACLVLAHGAGAGMNHGFMEAVAHGLRDRGMATLRFQFPYMERGSKRPDPAPLAQATIRSAVAAAADLVPGLPLIAGGKSFGGRMTSQAQADNPLPGVIGLAFVGFPLHQPGKPSNMRARPLSAIDIPMLFLQGTRDALADQDLLAATLEHLPSATLRLFEQADHSFHVPVRSGRTDREVLDAMLDTLVTWSRTIRG